MALHMVVSVDARGMIEYWDCETLSFLEPAEARNRGISFLYKTETDLYALAKVGGSCYGHVGCVGGRDYGDIFVLNV